MRWSPLGTHLPAVALPLLRVGVGLAMMLWLLRDRAALDLLLLCVLAAVIIWVRKRMPSAPRNQVFVPKGIRQSPHRARPVPSSVRPRHGSDGGSFGGGVTIANSNAPCWACGRPLAQCPKRGKHV
jgi:hypothetical protein